MAGTTMQELVQFLLKASNKGVWHHLFSRRRPVASTTSTEPKGSGSSQPSQGSKKIGSMANFYFLISTFPQVLFSWIKKFACRGGPRGEGKDEAGSHKSQKKQPKSKRRTPLGVG
ncbi:hypothetical protein I7I51_03650 [Histoplasma capsulatum]|uniref:Uncharacterized protein n=1 Tax=Ajellomyces capsulatus TaxID=5037 RepID=A0A8A1M705_AJECA|nr:hypothetical protein I7I51_03650 [Histoplasma capsulatum]